MQNKTYRWFNLKTKWSKPDRRKTVSGQVCHAPSLSPRSGTSPMRVCLCLGEMGLLFLLNRRELNSRAYNFLPEENKYSLLFYCVRERNVCQNLYFISAKNYIYGYKREKLSKDYILKAYGILTTFIQIIKIYSYSNEIWLHACMSKALVW